MSFLKKNFITKIFLLYAILSIYGIFIIIKVINIQYIKGYYWQSISNNLNMKYVIMNSERGAIYSQEGSLLVCSMPTYDLRIDMKTKSFNSEVFYSNVDKLSFDISNLFNDNSNIYYKKKLIKAYENGNRFFLLKRNIMYSDLKQMLNFSILKSIKLKNGLIIIENNDNRIYLFSNLAKRILGYYTIKLKPVGIEGGYNDYLKGNSIKVLIRRISNNILIPINNSYVGKIFTDIPKGNDIISSININLQDIIHQILLKQLLKHDADWGTIILMEVQTGFIRAMVNLSKDTTNNSLYKEQYNYAIGFSCEPGSLFKLPSVMVGFEDNKFNISTIIDNSNQLKIYDKIITNSSYMANNDNTLINAFAKSSNVSIAKIIFDHYHDNPQSFVNKLYDFGLNKKMEDISIPGSGKIFISNPKHKYWSNLSLPCMSYGYGISLTPLQILTFYNGIANNGCMLKPIFVTAIKNDDGIIKSIHKTIINETMSTFNTIKNAQLLLRHVIEQGTGQYLKSVYCNVAGKTGTTIIFNKQYGYKNIKKEYRSSFCGYFPYENPDYSIIAVISNPKNGKYYASDVILPIVKDIINKILLQNSKYYPDIDNIDHKFLYKKK